MTYTFDDAEPPSATTHPVLRDVLQPRHLPRGLDRGHPAPHAVGDGAELPALDDDVWELYDTTTDWTQAHDLAAEKPDKLAELQRLFLDEATKYNVLPLDDRRVERFNPDLAGRPTLIKGNYAAALRRHGSPHRELRAQHQEQVALGHRRGRRARGRRRGRDHRPGRRVRRLEPLRARTASRRTATTSSASQRFTIDGDSADPGRHAPGAHGVRLRRRRARQGRHRHALRRRRAGRRGARRAHRADGLLRPTRPPTSAATRPRRSADDYTPESSSFTGTVDWVQIDIDDGAEDLDHLITPEERLRVAMARQ